MTAVPPPLALLVSSPSPSRHAVQLPPPEITSVLNVRRSFRVSGSQFRCFAGQTGFFTRLGRLIKEKAKSDVEKIVSGFSKTRENLAVIDELLLYWNLADTDRVLDELEEVAPFSFSFANDKLGERLGSDLNLSVSLVGIAGI